MHAPRPPKWQLILVLEVLSPLAFAEHSPPLMVKLLNRMFCSFLINKLSLTSSSAREISPSHTHPLVINTHV